MYPLDFNWIIISPEWFSVNIQSTLFPPYVAFTSLYFIVFTTLSLEEIILLIFVYFSLFASISLYALRMYSMGEENFPIPFTIGFSILEKNLEYNK